MSKDKDFLIKMIDSLNHVNTHSFINNDKLVRENIQLKYMLSKCNEFRAIEELMKENNELKKQLEKLKK